MTSSAVCCIAGCGPAGALVGYLLARAGVPVVVLEKHNDFLRDFRGDTIHPSTLEILDDLGLEAAIEWHTQEFAEWSGCACTLDLRIGPLPRNRDRDIAVFRILQESLTNVARHAKASNVTVRAFVADDDLTLEVSDDGIGIPWSELNSPTSLGMIGMRERADALGGAIQFASGERPGSTVTLRLPVIGAPILEGTR